MLTMTEPKLCPVSSEFCCTASAGTPRRCLVRRRAAALPPRRGDPRSSAGTQRAAVARAKPAVRFAGRPRSTGLFRAERSQSARPLKLGEAGAAGGIASDVNDDPPQPGFQWPFAAEAAPIPQRTSERFLYDVSRRFRLADDRICARYEGAELLFVERRDCCRVSTRSITTAHRSTTNGEPLFFSQERVRRRSPARAPLWNSGPGECRHRLRRLDLKHCPRMDTLLS